MAAMGSATGKGTDPLSAKLALGGFVERDDRRSFKRCKSRPKHKRECDHTDQSTERTKPLRTADVLGKIWHLEAFGGPSLDLATPDVPMPREEAVRAGVNAGQGLSGRFDLANNCRSANRRDITASATKGHTADQPQFFARPEHPVAHLSAHGSGQAVPRAAVC